MTLRENADNVVSGFVSGALLPVLTGLIIFLITADGITVGSYLRRISETNIMTHAITLCVFPNVIIFLIFNRFDMLRACQGVLAITIVWAIMVFAIKFFG